MKCLLLASGFSARQVHDYDYKGNGWTIVAINNGWMACPTLWDHWIKSSDYKGNKPETIHPHQKVVPKYRPSLDKFGGQKACGYSITLNAGYWALHRLAPKVIGFLGADMNYDPDDRGHTHIYGVGFDIQKNEIPDPERMVRQYGKDDPDYLHNIYMRLAIKAEQNNCKVYNLSQNIDTRLPYERIKPEKV